MGAQAICMAPLSRRLRLLRYYSWQVHRRGVQTKCNKQWNSGKTTAAKARAGKATWSGAQATAGTEADASYAAAVEDEMQQLRILAARGALSSSSEEDFAQDDEDHEDEDAVESELSVEEHMGSLPITNNYPGAELPFYGGGSEYWDSKHANDKDTYEWMQGYADLSDVIAKCTNGNKEVRVLHVGCGSSMLPEDMYDDGYQNIVNVDISSIVIGRMRERNKQMRPKMTWLAMDATALKLKDAGFDVVLDKCTLDTFVTCPGSNAVVGAYLEEVVRVLKRSAVFLVISFGRPDARMRYLTEAHLNFQVETIKLPVPYTKSRFHFAYICRKV